MKETLTPPALSQRLQRLTATTLCTLILGSGLAIAQTVNEEEDELDDEDLYTLSPFEVSPEISTGYTATTTLGGTRVRTNLVDMTSALSTVTAEFLGATVGGQQDISYFRQTIKNGLLPDPNSISPEGLFSEYDLPLNSRSSSKDVLRIEGEAMQASVIGLPQLDYLAQVGFSSGIEAANFKRPPLNLAVVVDVSGSMQGEPLEMVKTSLIKMLGQLQGEDRICLIAFSDSAHMLLPSRVIQGKEAGIIDAIENLETIGGTCIEAGLRMGYEHLLKNKDSFQGISRVLLLTDEQPNIGYSDTGSFMALTTDASIQGIGLTTLGVGMEFDARFAAQVSNVRGGNVFYFSDLERMESFFEEEFTTFGIELAYDMVVQITPTEGMEISAIFGIPGELLEWTEDQRGLSFAVETLFLSKERGGIFIGLSSTNDAPNEQSLASASVIYTLAGTGEEKKSSINFPLIDCKSASLGLRRGEYLINLYTSMNLAAWDAKQEQVDQQTIQRLNEMLFIIQNCGDPELIQEAEVVNQFISLLTPSKKSTAGLINDTTDTIPNRLQGTWYSRNMPMIHPSLPVKLEISANGQVDVYACQDEGDIKMTELTLSVSKRKLVFGNEGYETEFDYHVVRERLALRWLDDDGKQHSCFLQPSDIHCVDESRIQEQLRGLPQLASSL